LAYAIKDNPQRLRLFMDTLTDLSIEVPDERNLTDEQLRRQLEEHHIAQSLPSTDPARRPQCPILAPILDVATRWNSTHSMLKRSLRIRPGLDKLGESERALWACSLEQPEWNNIEEVVRFLEPFAVVTKHIEGYKYPTLSVVVPLYNQLLETLKKWSEDELALVATRSAAYSAITKLEKYYNKTSSCNIIATVCDPRLKKHYFERKGWKDVDGQNLMDKFVDPM